MHIENANELIGRAVEIVIHHDVVVAVSKGKLMGGVCHTQLDCLGRLGTATDQTLAEHLKRRRLDKDQHGLGETLLNLQGTLTSISKIREAPEASLDVTSLTNVP